MAILQVRDVPDDLYKNLSNVAKQENRSISQETIVLLRSALQLKEERISKRKFLLSEIAEFNRNKENRKFPDPVEMIREDRER